MLQGASLIAVLQNNHSSTTGIAIYRGMCIPKTFTAQFETEAMQFVPARELLDIYFGEKVLLHALMVRAKIISPNKPFGGAPPEHQCAAC